MDTPYIPGYWWVRFHDRQDTTIAFVDNVNGYMPVTVVGSDECFVITEIVWFSFIGTGPN